MIATAHALSRNNFGFGRSTEFAGNIRRSMRDADTRSAHGIWIGIQNIIDSNNHDGFSDGRVVAGETEEHQDFDGYISSLDRGQHRQDLSRWTSMSPEWYSHLDGVSGPNNERDWAKQYVWISPLKASTVVDVHSTAAALKCFNAIDQMASLEDGWLDGSGLKISANIREAVKRFVSLLAVVPDFQVVVPTEEGGILLEYRSKGWAYGIEFDPDQSAAFFGIEIDGKSKISHDFTQDQWDHLAEKVIGS